MLHVAMYYLYYLYNILELYIIIITMYLVNLNVNFIQLSLKNI